MSQDPHVDGSCFFKEDKLTDESKLQPYLYYFIAALITVRTLTLIINWRQLKRYRDSIIDPYLSTDFNQ